MTTPGEEIRNNRIEKLKQLASLNIDPYPERCSFALTEISAVRGSLAKYIKSRKAIGIAGRIVAKREHGRSAFVDIFDGTDRFQLFIAEDRIGEDAYRRFVDLTDVGDFMGAKGKVFYTKRKEPTVEVTTWEMLAKSLRPLPEKWHGLSDVEERFRKRYLDLIMNGDVRRRFMARSSIISCIRDFLQKEDYMEVETPLLHPIAGGALARPFVTHHHALDQDFYLRIAPELYLKRLLVGGFPRVFEMGRNFRNEGIDHTHNPEFTMLELYASFETREDLMKLTHDLFGAICKRLYKKTKFEFGGNSIDLTKFKTISFNEAMERYAAIPMYDAKSHEDILIYAQRFGVNPEKADTKAKIADMIFKKAVRPKFIQPTFLTDHPLEISPLAKINPERSDTTLRFQYIVGGFELANGFSELNDPIDQAGRFRGQEKLKEKGESEAMSYDEDFVEALEYGMPPAAGLGIGIDRLTMLFTGADNIKEVILFPTMRSK